MKNVVFFISFVVLAGCTHNVRVVVNLYPSDPDIIDLPICYLDNCSSISADQCADNALQSSLNIKSVAWRLLSNKPNAILSSGARSFYIQTRGKVNISEIESQWSEVGCAPHAEDNNGHRYRECTRFMPGWVRMINSENGHMTHLLSDPSYRDICLRLSN
jgi:hypothetical protein